VADHPAAAPAPARAGTGPLLQQWRRRRRLSQLQLASDSGVSTRHLSFVETGRARPSRELILHLAEHLDVPLRERNRMLLAAGFAPAYSEERLDAPQMTAVLSSLELVLRGHEPFPALVMNRRFELLAANRAVDVLTDGMAPELLVPPVNVLRAALHPDGLARRVVNLGEYRAHALNTLRRALDAGPDRVLAELHRELSAFEVPAGLEEVPEPPLAALVLPIRLRAAGPGATELTFFSTVATFGSPRDITLSELAIETFFPADAATEAALRARAARRDTA
jgi:transcriptional regulator with XRE-family HTH domain